jgi:2-polyprenyl-3-methyl-5-hydroxy-6-metoxy-1,4-benzoquinol methylase
MNFIKRKYDVISGLEDLEKCFTIPKFPVFMGCVETDRSSDVFFDMNWSIAKQSGAVQLSDLLPLDVLYSTPHGSGSVGKLWMEHHKALANFIDKFSRSLSAATVLEIGGAHGLLSKEYHSHHPDSDWTIIEPNPAPSRDIKAKFIKGFFDNEFRLEKAVDVIVHSHVLEHIYEPAPFLKSIASFMPEGKLHIFSVPNMEVMLNRKYTNCVNFEHTIFLAEPYIDYLLSESGFEILEKHYFKEDHSIFYASVRKSAPRIISLPLNQFRRNRALFTEYLNYYLKLITNLNTELAKLPPGCSIFLFGGHVFSQYLIAFGLDTSRVKKVLDNDPAKRGKRLYGTNLTVDTPEVLYGLRSPVVILKTGVYDTEIRDAILSEVNPSTIFLQ